MSDNPYLTDKTNETNRFSLQNNSFINNQGPVQVGLFFEDNLEFDSSSQIEGENSSFISLPFEQNSNPSDSEQEFSPTKTSNTQETFFKDSTPNNGNNNSSTALAASAALDANTNVYNPASKNILGVNPNETPNTLSKLITHKASTKLIGRDSIPLSLRKPYVNPMLKKSPLGDISQHIVHNTLAIHLPNTAPALSDTEQNNTTRNAPTLLNISHTSDVNTDLTEISPFIKANPTTDNASTQTAPTNNSSHTPENATLFSKINTTTPCEVLAGLSGSLIRSSGS